MKTVCREVGLKHSHCPLYLCSLFLVSFSLPSETPCVWEFLSRYSDCLNTGHLYWVSMFKNNRTIWWSFTFILFVPLFLFHIQCSHFSRFMFSNFSIFFLLLLLFFLKALSSVVEKLLYRHTWGFPGGSFGKESTSNAADLGSIPGSERFLGEANDNPVQYSCLDRGAGRATVYGVPRVRCNLVTKAPHTHT